MKEKQIPAWAREADWSLGFSEVARRAGVSRQWAQVIAKRLEVKPPATQRRDPATQRRVRQLIRRHIRAGKTVQEIAALLRIPARSVRERLGRMNLSAPTASRDWSPVTRKMWQTMTNPEISAFTGYPVRAVAKERARLKIPSPYHRRARRKATP